MKDIFLLLGSNRGDRFASLLKAKEMIASEAGTIVACSSVYETEPWGFSDPVKFLNQVLEIDSNLEPAPLLEVLLSLEKKLGRIRNRETACQTGCLTDIPLDGLTFSTEPLTVPSPAIMADPDSPAQRPSSYTARTIDIDLLFYGHRLIFTEELMVPHPRMHERLFTLIPLCEITPDFIHPVLKKSIRDLVRMCTDRNQVIRI